MRATTTDRSTVWARVRRWMSYDGSDPRPLQLAFSALVLLDLAFRMQGGARYDLVSGPVLAVVLLAVVTAGVMLVPWQRLPWSALAVLAVLDIAVVGTCRLSPEGSGLAMVVVLPALWLGRVGTWRGPAVCGLAVSLLVALPGLLYFGASGANLSRSVLPAVVGVAVALSVASAVRTIEQEQRMSDAVFDTVDVGLVLLDRTGRYLRMNRRHAEFMALAFPDGHAGLAGQLGAVWDADGTTLLGREDMPSHRASRGEEFDDCRIWVGGDPQRRRALSVSARSVRDPGGALVGAALAYKDVTDFMDALRVKDEFVASVSHELRTPLTSIIGYAQILREREDLPEQAHGQLGVMARNADRLQRLIGDLLHTAQARNGRLQLERRECDLATIVHDCVQAVAPAADAAGIRVGFQAPGPVTLVGDPGRLGQVVDNLLSNAVKYTPCGGTVEAVVRVDGDRAELEVHDDGVGIGAADREQLFTRFFRAARPGDVAVPGVGLGLSIVKEIVESHGGRIEVESQPGSGSVFRVRLPRTPAEGG